MNKEKIVSKKLPFWLSMLFTSIQVSALIGLSFSAQILLLNESANLGLELTAFCSAVLSLNYFTEGAIRRRDRYLSRKRSLKQV